MKKLKITTRKHKPPTGLARVTWLPGGYGLYINGERSGGVSPMKKNIYDLDIIWVAILFSNEKLGFERWQKYWKTEEVADRRLKEELNRQLKNMKLSSEIQKLVTKVAQ